MKSQVNDLNIREQQVLFNIVENYIELCEPIGSRFLAKLHTISLSSATLRNVMADLTERGLIQKSHVSSGRMPTDRGYRFYVDNLSSQQQKNSKISEIYDIINAYYEEIPRRLDDLLKGTALLMAEITKLACVVTLPEPSNSVMKTIEFFNLNREQVLVILITKTGMVKHKVIQLRDNLEQDFLNSVGEYLNKLFSGTNIQEVREKLFSAFMEEQQKYPEQFAQAIRLGKQAFEHTNDEDPYYINGQSNIFEWPEFSNIEQLKKIHSAFEERNEVIDLLNSQNEGVANETIHVSIGKEHQCDIFEDCTIISAAYGTKKYSLGCIGVIGPKRMQYNQVIPLVEQASKMLTDKIDQITAE